MVGGVGGGGNIPAGLPPQVSGDTQIPGQGTQVPGQTGDVGGQTQTQATPQGTPQTGQTSAQPAVVFQSNNPESTAQSATQAPPGKSLLPTDDGAPTGLVSGDDIKYGGDPNLGDASSAMLKANMEKTRGKIETLNAKIENCGNQIKGLQTARAELQKEIASLRNQISNERSKEEPSTKTIANLEAQIARKEAAIGGIDSSIEKLEGMIKEFKGDIQDARSAGTGEARRILSAMNQKVERDNKRESANSPNQADPNSAKAQQGSQQLSPMQQSLAEACRGFIADHGFEAAAHDSQQSTGTKLS